MGQEASLPVDVVDDLDAEARAPPSSTNPPPVSSAATSGGGGGSGTSANSNAASGRSGGTRPAAKMIGAMFHRGGGGGGGENYESREIARAAASGGNLYLNDDKSEEYNNYSVNGNGNGNGNLPQSQSEDSQHQHQQHHLQQPPPPPPPNYPQQQQQGYYGEQQQVPASGSASVNVQHSEPDSQIVSVMYEGKAPSKKGLSRASARGAALINSMRNLSLGGALRSSKQQNQNQQQHQQNQASAQVNDWEKQWDEDEDDSEGEDEPDLLQQGSIVANQNQAGGALPLHQIRPGMDAGHSSAPQQQQQHLHHQQQQQQHEHDVALEFQQLASPSAILPPMTAPLSPTKAQANFISPESLSQQQQLQLQQQQQQQQLGVHTGDLLSDPNVVVIPMDDGLEWDTNVHGVEEVGNLKPNVQMFLPMLRVLGKGSFGKVRYMTRECAIAWNWIL
jgi:hypothetical protein